MMSGPRYGDAVMLAEGYSVPETVRMNDTVRIPFSVAAARIRVSAHTPDIRGESARGDSEISKHRSRLSRPLADRIGMHVTLTPLLLERARCQHACRTVGAIRGRVELARVTQRRRYAAGVRVACNAHAAGAWLLAHGQIDAEARLAIVDASESLQLSARACQRVLRVARAIADLTQADVATSAHVAEALRCRPRS